MNDEDVQEEQSKDTYIKGLEEYIDTLLEQLKYETALKEELFARYVSNLRTQFDINRMQFEDHGELR